MLTLREKHEYEQEIAELKAELIKVRRAGYVIKSRYEKLKSKLKKSRGIK